MEMGSECTRCSIACFFPVNARTYFHISARVSHACLSRVSLTRVSHALGEAALFPITGIHVPLACHFLSSLAFEVASFTIFMLMGLRGVHVPPCSSRPLLSLAPPGARQSSNSGELPDE